MKYNSFLLLCSAVSIDFASAILRTSKVGSSDFVFEQVHSQLNKVIETSRSLLTAEEILLSQDICGGFSLIANQLPNGESSCICNGYQVDCTLEGECSEDRSVCTDVVAMSFQFLVGEEKVQRMKLSACFTYTEEFEPTCIEAVIGRDQTLKRCNKATYAGKQCLCAVCDDAKSLALDCSRHHPMATSNGCYLLSEAIPVLTKFDEPPQNNYQGRRTTEQTSDGSSWLHWPLV